MTAIKKTGLVLTVIAAIFSISVAKNNRQTTESNKVVFEYREFHKQYIDADSSRLYIDIYYPEIISAPGISAKNAINGYIKEVLLNEAYYEKKADSLDDLASWLFRDFSEEQRFRTQEDLGRRDWQYRDSVWVSSDSYGILSIAFDYFSFTTGMHQNYGRNYSNFDTYSGNQVYLSDVLKKDYENKLRKIVHNHFRQVRKEIPMESSLMDTSFWIGGSGFPITENYSIGSDGIIFYYNPYDILSFADGETELLVKYDEIGDLIDEKGLLKRPPR